MQDLESFKDFLLSSDRKHAMINYHIEHNELFVILGLNFLRDFLVFLKTNEKFSFQVLTDLCGVDYPDREDRFQVVYNLLSLTSNLRLTIKINAKEDQLVPSVCDIYSAANWYEREAWDMYGIYFSGHPDLRRILTDYGFIGHPMRKDFPLTGFSEVRYDIEKKKVIYEKVKLTQDFRSFDFASPWEGTDYILPGDEKATK
ncbi:MAG: NADH-quinone oxidoreductase subunit C [Candidatus Midichloria mitochondrii]|uniref:NADH-quinone oxidoreductase subunit C n=1 Tax=Midichloria mitochondrii (strain IricVA) TaxID=696127 RepID=F7XUU0_MIDMI|nr:NADH-quinone oxidoreductase subunit C [Candidatus Midichloria mitochondrii]AEI88439.1 NADH:ubiquinone oxidoreductase subunit C [Candidatus Midichloria mitochondrii IricVA]MDJ1256195.1 NADH-quinone oxidoreductase subunit C [Candidatus Midichloria mitochondrii]MDJ1287869.1 NADH-quinone oxidoreductase subunit C [Candidatus Midichloria mitochondrii]MDJ1298757.1 NADH-quinone oxidoreductase subunit C [Candidatus Midichloria mitochondrii]MDJ1312911.1 NADH-quinone oxidoreductase subunit C [Candidat